MTNRYLDTTSEAENYLHGKADKRQVRINSHTPHTHELFIITQ